MIMRTVAQFIFKQKRFYGEKIVILPTDIKGDFRTDNRIFYVICGTYDVEEVQELKDC